MPTNNAARMPKTYIASADTSGSSAAPSRRSLGNCARVLLIVAAFRLRQAT
jgi:hypothetical protein